MLIYLITNKPFKDKVQNIMEIINETTFATVTMSYIMFTDFNEDYDCKLYVGWGLIGATLLNILVNYLVVLYKTVT